MKTGGAPTASAMLLHNTLAAIAHEERIVWLEHPETVGRFVREEIERSYYPRSHPRWLNWQSWKKGPGRNRLIAYAVLKRGLPSRREGHLRRLWYIAPHDAECYADTGTPMEAVDPCGIRAGQPSPRPR